MAQQNLGQQISDFEQQISDIQSKMDSLDQNLAEFQKASSFAQGTIQEAEKQLVQIKSNLFDLTGIDVDDNPDAIIDYITSGKTELESIINDVVTMCPNLVNNVDSSNFIVTEQDVSNLEKIINDHNIPMS